MALGTHSDSHAKFFDRYYDTWTKGLSDCDVEPQFVWITPDRRDAVKHGACDKWPEHIERFMHLQDVNAMIWRKYQDAKLLDEARPALAGCLTALGNITADERIRQ
jgi:hypothetical protein